jgi:predicted GH43/DUF377 family glycosyl hydrolase
MKTLNYLSILILLIVFFGCQNKKKSTNSLLNKSKFANEMVEFTPYEGNPLFSGTGSDTWDKLIRERGYILLEDGVYKMWYSGYNDAESDPKFLGYATSVDGINWDRYSEQPIFDGKWSEDMFVVKNDGTYFMYAEGKNDITHLLISGDGINWEEQGDIVILTVNGDTIPEPYGTPTVLIEDGKWSLLYERNDEAIWLAVSNDHLTWTNVQDEPVLEKGPLEYDAGAVAVNQVVKYEDNYYMFYHGSSNPDWADPNANALWSSNVAMSSDLINLEKYHGNPIVEGDTSSPILVFDGKKYRLYTMHANVALYLPK